MTAPTTATGARFDKSLPPFLPPFSKRTIKKAISELEMAFLQTIRGLDGTRTRDLRRDRAAF